MRRNWKNWLQLPGIRVEQEYRGLVIGQAFFHIARPVTTRLYAEREAGFIETRLEPV